MLPPIDESRRRPPPAGGVAASARRVRAAGCLILLAATPLAAQESDSVTACETLLAARRTDAAGPAATPDPACRRVPRSAVGPVEQRALIGGAPYECLAVAGAGRCLWIVP